MIALSGCARKNADRELARVVALIERRIAHAHDEAVADALRDLVGDLSAHWHREVTPDLPPFEADRTR